MFLFILAVVVLLLGISLLSVGNIVPGIVLTILGIVVFILARKRRAAKATKATKAADAPQSAPSPAPAPQAKPADPEPPQLTPYQQRLANAKTLHFKIAGTSFKGRQTTLRKLMEAEEDKYILSSYHIEQTEYEGKPAFRIYVQLDDKNQTEKDIGFVPADLVDDVLAIYHTTAFKFDVEVYGGPTPENENNYYGAAGTIWYDPE